MNQIDKLKVTDRQSFVKFLELLSEDLRGNKSEWQNKTLEDFIEAMSRYAEDIQGFYDNTRKSGEVTNADVASWQTFSDIFKGARIYE
jgi:hypothetical protein